MTVSTTPPSAGPRVRADRLLDRLEALRVIGGTQDGGVTRPAFGRDDVRARELAAAFMNEAGLAVRVDAAANLIGIRAGRDAGLGTLMLGSHLDTVPGGGAFDGAYGVVAAIEAAHTLNEHDVQLNHPIAVVAFSNEEGLTGTTPMFGSRAIVGRVDDEELARPTADGRELAAVLDAAGGDGAAIGGAVWPTGSIAAFVEAHIEQGPVLERERERIGVVEAISGRQTVAVTITGTAAHAGTTPMDGRRDALVAAAHVILGVPDIAGPSGAVRVATVGDCTVRPAAWNVVPGSVRLIVDLRDVRTGALEAGLDGLRALADRVAARTGAAISVDPMARVAPTRCDPRLRALVSAAADELGLAHRVMPSGAGHDTQWLARIAPTAMIFVPSRGGVSHVPEEYTTPADLTAGADVLLRVLVMSDRVAWA